MGRKPQKNDSLPGSLDMLILKMLTWGNLHGYAIAQLIQQTSGEEILVERLLPFVVIEHGKATGGRGGAAYHVHDDVDTAEMFEHGVGERGAAAGGGDIRQCEILCTGELLRP